MEEEVQVVDLAPFLAAVVLEAGGEVVVKLESLAGIDGEVMSLAIDPTEDETGLSIRLVSPPPVEE